MYGNVRPQQRYNFTKTFIDGLPANPRNAKSREKEYADQQVIGLRILVSKSARKFWHLRYRFRKKKRVISIGEFPAVAVQEARKRANEYKNLLSQGLDPLTERDKQDTNITFKEFVEKEYIPYIKSNKKTWQDDLSKIEKHMIPTFGDFPMSSITVKALKNYQANIKNRNSPSTSNRHMTVIISIFNQALQYQVIDKNPCTGVIKKYREPTREVHLYDNELKRFLEALDNTNQNNVSTHAIRMLLFTGLRKSEVTTLKWDEVGLGNGNETLRLLTTKSGQSRTVVLNQLAIDTLEKMKEMRVNDYVFPGKGPRGHIISLRNIFLKIVENAGIQKLRLHDLRHIFASICANAGKDFNIIQSLLGHNSSQMTRRYVHLANKELRATTESVADKIKDLAGYTEKNERIKS